MRIERVPLNTRSLGHHADGGGRRPDAAMQINGSLDDTLARLRLLIGPLLEGVCSCHNYFVTLACALIIDKPLFRYTRMYIEI